LRCVPAGDLLRREEGVQAGQARHRVHLDAGTRPGGPRDLAQVVEQAEAGHVGAAPSTELEGELGGLGVGRVISATAAA
jgi:hypothetical protein